jgi:hypothetical protein
MTDQEDLRRVVQKGGKPLMISRYGARIMDIGGTLYLVAATPKELATAMAQNPAVARGRTIETIEYDLIQQRSGRAFCSYDGTDCAEHNGCTDCELIWLGGGVLDCACQHS